MPEKIPIEKVISQIPKFVQIIPETYRGVRYKAQFIDLEYNEMFWAIPHSVIKLQHGCTTRSNHRKSETTKGTKIGCRGGQRKHSIEYIKSQLPEFLEIDESTYISSNKKAQFYDKEYKVYFTAIVANIIRGAGYCPQRQRDEFLKKINKSIKEVKDSISKKYGNRIQLIEGTYINAQSTAQWLIDGKIITARYQNLIRNPPWLRKEWNRWKMKVLVRDNFKCVNCKSEDDLQTHHIIPWRKSEQLRFELNNGATLCKTCHQKYHSLFYRRECSESFQKFLSDPETKP